MHWKLTASIAMGALIVANSAAEAQIRITEWMYTDTPEFVEFTNVGTLPVDMTGWSFDDDSRLAGTVDLSAFGTVLPGESVLLVEGPAATFRTSWSLDPLVDIIGDNATNLSRGDEINLYDNSSTLVDRLTYGDQVFIGSIRTNDVSGNPMSPAALGINDVYQWQLSFVGDTYGSYANASSQIGNPGSYVAIPEPGSLVMLALGATIIGLRRRK
jgi:predicted extracellular nuclease